MSRRAFTLPEALVALSLVTILATGVFQLRSQSTRAFERISKDVEVQTRWAVVQERLVRELRTATAFRTPKGEPGPVVVVRTGRGTASREYEVRFERGGLVTRVEGERTDKVAAALPLADLTFEAVTPRLLSMRAKLAWTDATQRAGSLVMQTRVMARNAPLGALEPLEEVAP